MGGDDERGIEFDDGPEDAARPARMEHDATETRCAALDPHVGSQCSGSGEPHQRAAGIIAGGLLPRRRMGRGFARPGGRLRRLWGGPTAFARPGGVALDGPRTTRSIHRDGRLP